MHLHASVGLVTPVAPGRFEAGVRVIVDLALHLMAATAAQELHLELHADHRQWCLRATDARGGTPAGVLLARVAARGPGMYREGSPSRAGPAGTWAARWGPNSFPGTEAFTASFWVGGPDYVTAMVQ